MLLKTRVQLLPHTEMALFGFTVCDRGDTNIGMLISVYVLTVGLLSVRMGVPIYLYMVGIFDLICDFYVQCTPSVMVREPGC